MKRHTALGIVFVLSCVCLTAQQPIPNADFEHWTLYEGSGLFNDYHEPDSGWSSGNGAIHVAPGADPVLMQSDDSPYSGMFCAQLVTRLIFAQVASGSMYTGRFELDLGNPATSAKQGIPFSDRPQRFTGQFKYAPVNGDSATLRVTLTKWTGSAQQLVGESDVKVYNEVGEWTAFDHEIEYLSDDRPDTIAVVFASSAGGESFRGEEGSTLWVDDIGLTYEAVSVDENLSSGPKWNAADRRFMFDESMQGAQIWIVDLQGATRRSLSGAQLTSSIDLPSGIYFASILTDGKMYSRRIQILR